MNGRRIYWFGLCLWAAFGLVLQINAQESGDGFTGSDRSMLSDVRQQVLSVKRDTQSIKQSVDADIIPALDAQSDILDDIQSDTTAIRSAQSYFNSTQQNMLNTLLNWESNGLPGTEDLPLIQLNTYNAATHLSYIRPDVADILDNTTEMNGHLLNIDRETTEASDYLASMVQQLDYLIWASTNNIGGGEDVLVALTNALSLYQSQPVDLSIVTNFLAAQSFPFFTATFFPDFGARYGELMRDMFGYDSDDEFTADDYATVFGSSQMGFFMSLLVQALFPNPDDIFDSIDTIIPNLFAYAWENFGNGGQDYNTALWVDWPYTIFDAYNTLGLGVLTNQMITVSNVLGEVRDLLSSNVAQVVKVNTSIGYDDSQDEDLNLEHGDDSRLPEWEERYQGHLADWTNSYYYESIFQGSYSRMAEASNVVNDFFSRLDQAPGDFHHTLTWSGLSFGADNPIGGWDLDVTISKDDPNFADVRSLTNGVFSVSMAFLNLCIVAYFMRRIYGKLMKSPLL